MAFVAAGKETREKTPMDRPENQRIACEQRTRMFEETMEAAQRARGQAMSWMTRTVESHAGGAEDRTRSVDEEMATFDRIMSSGQEAMRQAMNLLGEMKV